jgi:FkbM family methyltransferase
MNLRGLGGIEQALAVAAHPHTSLHFSQFGEDAILESMLGILGLGGGPGFYVDVGAFHPSQISNTRLLHLRGWSGVNIDANPDAIALFNQQRPRDRNIHAAVSDVTEDVEFSIYRLAALSTADPASKAAYDREGRGELVRTIRLRTRTLRDLLAEAVPEGRKVDVMSVDVEGYDLRALRSNDWSRVSPRVLLVEDPALSLGERPGSEIFRFLRPLGYRLASQAYITSLYVRE